MEKRTTPTADGSPLSADADAGAGMPDAGDAASTTSEESDARSKASRAPAKIRFERRMAIEEAIAYFEAIVGGLKKRTIEFRHGHDVVALVPASQVDVAIKASCKGFKEKVAFELSWVAPSDEGFEIA